MKSVSLDRYTTVFLRDVPSNNTVLFDFQRDEQTFCYNLSVEQVREIHEVFSDFLDRQPKTATIEVPAHHVEAILSYMESLD